MRTFTTVWWHWYNRCRKEFPSTSKVLLTLLVLGSFFVPKNVEAQACDPSYFDVNYTYELDIEGNQTIYTWTITDQNAPNAISHWGFSLNACVPAVVQQFLDAADAFKLVNGEWQPVNYVYGQDNSQNCETGAVLKFDEGITPGVATSYRLVVDGWWSNGIADIYLKYGNQCCIEDTPNTDQCLERICPAVLCNITQNTNAQCPGASNTYTATANMESYAWTVTGNGQISGAANQRNVTVISGNICGPYTLTLVTTKNGCRFECSKVFNVVDTELPVITLTALGSVPCNPTMVQINAAFGTASVTDNCSQGLVANGVLGDITGTGCNRSVTKTWMVTDACGNIGTNSQTLTWIVDETAPVVTNGATSFTLGLGCNPSNIESNFVAPVFDGGCTTAQVTYNAGQQSGTGCNRTWTRSWEATDCSGLKTTITQTLTWTVDNTAPTVTNGATSFTLGLGCNPSNIESNFVAPTFDGGCSQASVTPNLGTSTVTGCNGTWTRSWEATDCSGLKTTITQTLTWTVDNTAPVVSNGATSFTKPLGCNPSNIEANFVAPTFDGGCSQATVTPNPGTASITGCNGTWTRSWEATDCSGLKTTITQTLTWTVDNDAPTVSNGATSFTKPLGCNPTNIEANFVTPTFSGGCSDATVTPNPGAASGPDCNRTWTRSWTATDCSGKTTTITQTLTWTVDNTPPVITLRDAVATLGCNPSQAAIDAAFGSVSTSDNCTVGNAVVTVDDVVVNGCQRSQKKTWNVSDACGNPAAPVSHTVTWTVDNAAPVVNNGATSFTKPLGCNPSNIEANFVAPTFDGGCSQATVTPTLGAPTGTGCNRSWTRSWEATDCSGLKTTITQTLTWTVDNTAPTVTNAATSFTLDLGCNPSNIEANFVTPTFSGGCSDATVTPNPGAASGPDCNRTWTRSWTANDCSGIPTTITQTLTWRMDNTPPVINLTGTTATLGCNPSEAAILAAFGSVSAIDNCTVGAPVVTIDDVVVNGCQRSQKRTWNVSDACGNPAAAVSHTVTWTVDNTAPTVTNGATSFTKPLGCNPSNIEANFVTPTFDGGCSSATFTTNAGTPTISGCNGTWTRSWTANDCSGIPTTITQTLTWTVDNTAPTVTNGATSFTKPLGCNPTNIEPNFVAPAFSGGCSDATVTPNPGAASVTGCNGTWTRSWEATDCSGLKTTITQTLTWTVDNTPPVTSGTPTSIEANCGTQFANLPWQTPTWSDACGGVTVVSDVITPNGQQNSCPAVYTRTWTVRDACNNRASFTQTITVPCCKACTYTQGFYGNFNGKACMEDGSIATASSLMTMALNAEPNDEFIFGSKTNNRYWILKLSDVNQGKISNIFKMLPGGGSSQMLGLNTSGTVSTFDNKSTWSVAPLQTKKPNEGKITNSLLAQTIVLYFNIETSPSLGSIALTSNVLITADVECGESTAIPGTNEEFELPSTIVTYLNNNSRGYDNTVAGLFQLANDVLGGINPDNLSLSAISEAVDVINNAFDECRVLVGYGDIGSSITFSREKEGSEQSKEVLSGKLSVTASPNPFNDKVRFTIESPVSGQGSLEVYNLIGQKVETVFQGFLIEGRGQTVEFKVAPANRTNLIYVLRVGGQQVTGKLINVK